MILVAGLLVIPTAMHLGAYDERGNLAIYHWGGLTIYPECVADAVGMVMLLVLAGIGVNIYGVA